MRWTRHLTVVVPVRLARTIIASTASHRTTSSGSGGAQKVASSTQTGDTEPGRDTASPGPGAAEDEASSQLSGGSGVVTVTISPDTQGRFGFNVKGGADQGVPVIVSRVAAGTPADKCEPRLSEGDQVVMINGRDVANTA